MEDWTNRSSRWVPQAEPSLGVVAGARSTLARLDLVVALAACVVAAAGCATETSADLVIEDGRVLRLDSDTPAATAVSVRVGRVVSLSAADATDPHRRRRRVIMPAFVEHHAHLLNVGLWLNDQDDGRLFLDMSRAPSLERANELVTPVLPRLRDDDVVTAFRLAAAALAARGVVEVDDAGALAPPGVVALNEDFGCYLDLLRQADAVEPLPVRVNHMIPAPSALADALLASAHDWRISLQVRVTHLKLFADGAMGSRGAALTHPSADDTPTAGVLRMPAAAILSLANRGLDAGLGVATHAIDDDAGKQVLDACERRLDEGPALERGRLRIEHFGYASEQGFASAAPPAWASCWRSSRTSMPTLRPRPRSVPCARAPRTSRACTRGAGCTTWARS